MFQYYYVTLPNGLTYSITHAECQTLIMLNLVVLVSTSEDEQLYKIRTEWN